MKNVRVYYVDAFTNRKFGGNAAGVVPDATGLSDQDMQNIARELNLSETAFLLPAEREGQFQVRYFTPKSEIDFCGHATIGAAWVMGTEYGWFSRSSGIAFETNVGVVPVDWVAGERGELARIFMRQVAPQVRSVHTSLEDVARAVGINVSDIHPSYPIRLGYTGNWHLLVPVMSRSAIDAAQPRLTELAEMNIQQQAVTTHLFTFSNGGNPYDIYTRDFGPAVGIAEDPVTGAANGALAGYLLLEGLLNPKEPHSLRIAQGDAVGRPGMVYVDTMPATPIKIRVGGSAVITISGQLHVD